MKFLIQSIYLIYTKLMVYTILNLTVIRRECRQTLGLELGQRTDIDISIIISLQQRKDT